MDADVLYHDEVVTRLVTSNHRSCLTLDCGAALDDEAVKVCIRNGDIVEFSKVGLALTLTCVANPSDSLSYQPVRPWN